jgi:hypothetical protein
VKEITRIGKAIGGPKNIIKKIVDKTIRELYDLSQFINTRVLTKDNISNPNQFLQTINAKKQFVGY